MIVTIIYTLLILFLALFYDFNNTKSRNQYIIVISVILFLISGLRNLHVGPDDTAIYYNSYLYNGHLTYSEVYLNAFKDPFYSVFARFLYDIIGPHYTILLCVYASIFVFSICRLLIKNKVEDPLVSFVILLAMGFFAFSMTGIRQTLAMSFTVLSYPYLKDRKLIKFVALVLVAALFHKSALCFLILYPLTYVKLDWKLIIMYIGIWVCVFVQKDFLLNKLLTSELDSRLEIYSELGSRGLSVSGLIQLLLFLIFSLIYSKDIIKRDSSSVILFHMLSLSIIFQLFAGTIAEFFRVAMYFSVFLILLIPKVISIIPNASRNLVRTCLIFLLLCYFLFMGSGKIPYFFFFN